MNEIFSHHHSSSSHFQLSNEVIRRCTAAIDLDKIFDGNITSSQKTLNECIECCQQWQEIYNNVSERERERVMLLQFASHSMDI